MGRYRDKHRDTYRKPDKASGRVQGIDTDRNLDTDQESMKGYSTQINFQIETQIEGQLKMLEQAARDPDIGKDIDPWIDLSRDTDRYL